MKLSTRARYALRSMMALSRLGDGETPVSLERIANSTGISRRYLEQLVIALKNASLLRSVAGRHGGYLLARPAEEIRLGEIVEASIGPINIVDCVADKGNCPREVLCSCRLLYKVINSEISEALAQHTLAEMSDRKWYNKMCKKANEPTIDAAEWKTMLRSY
jgi:Rrf2 family protein